MMRILGIDYGERRIGLAISDRQQLIAQPLRTIEYDDIRVAIEEITALCEEESVKLIILGDPIHLSGDTGTIGYKVRAFSDSLSKSTGKEIIMMDERFSSVEAERAVRALGDKPSLNKAKIDNIAAALILDAFLQRDRDD